MNKNLIVLFIGNVYGQKQKLKNRNCFQAMVFFLQYYDLCLFGCTFIG